MKITLNSPPSPSSNSSTYPSTKELVGGFHEIVTELFSAAQSSGTITGAKGAALMRGENETIGKRDEQCFLCHLSIHSNSFFFHLLWHLYERECVNTEDHLKCYNNLYSI